MGADTTIYTYDRMRCDTLLEAVTDLTTGAGYSRLLRVVGSEPDISAEFTQRFEKLKVDGELAPRIQKLETQVSDFFARLFFRYCSPASLSFTSASFLRYLYARSPYLERLFTVEGFTGESMALFLGPGAVRVNPETARQMWTEIMRNLPLDMSEFYPADVQELVAVDAKLDKRSFRNVSIGYL